MKTLSNVKKARKFSLNTSFEYRNSSLVILPDGAQNIQCRRFIKIKEHLDQSDANLLRHIPSGPQTILFEALWKDLNTFEIVTKQLQLADISLLDVRLIFDEMVKSSRLR